MKHFYLISNESRDREMAFARRLADYIESKDGTAVTASNSASEPATVPEDTECLIVLGGDGTFIRNATTMVSLGLPVIGVNLGSLGYLCELDEKSVFPAIDRLMQNDYYVEERMMLTGAGKDEKQHLALNDVVVHCCGEQNFLSLRVRVNGVQLTDYHCDGVILATPTGSTGYSLSAGGPIVDPKASMILLTPISDHNLASKSIVLDAEDEIEITLEERRAERDEEACVSFDGDRCVYMKVGDSIRVRKSGEVIRVLRLDRKSFLEILRRKMERYM